MKYASSEVRRTQYNQLPEICNICILLDYCSSYFSLTLVKTYEDMTLEELEDNEDEFNEEDERAVEMYRLEQLAEFTRF